MGAGKYRERITIQKPTKGTDASGGPCEIWADFLTTKAEVQLGSGREYFGAKRNNAELSGLIKIRYRPGLQSSMRIIYKDRILEIIAPPINVGERNREIELHVRELMP